jgi:preprotein translocase subunit SecE
MKKIKVKGKEGSGQVVKLRPAKPRTSWRAKLPSVGEYGRITRQFILEAVQELKKVTWPERRETLGTTAIVLFLVLVISAFLGLVDLGLSKLVSGFIR